MNGMRCDHCRYVEMLSVPDGTILYRCHRLPPHIHNNTATWPSVSRDDWCGEWEKTK